MAPQAGTLSRPGPAFRRAAQDRLGGPRRHAHDLESSIVRAALRGAATFLGRGRGDLAEWMVRRALVVSPYDERLYRGLLARPRRKGTGHGWLDHGTAAHLRWRDLRGSGGRRWRSKAEPGGGPAAPRLPAPTDGGALPRPASRVSLPPEGAPPGCRVASRHGEKLLWEIGRTRCRDGWWRHLSRADAGELVRRAGGHRADRGRIGRLRQVPLQPEPAGRRADCRARRGTPDWPSTSAGRCSPRWRHRQRLRPG